MKIDLQETSYDIWDKKYRVRDCNGNPVDETPNDSKDRVARALAQVEKSEVQRLWEKRFRDALDTGAIPAGRIFSNAGAEEHKNAVSLLNCTVSDTIEDSMHGILSKLYESGMTLRAGCGIGYEFSSLRPKGSYVFGAGASTSGPLSFMDVYDKMCFTIASAGGRRGAQMATFDVRHPDVIDFIRAKREDGRLRQFNLSVLITDEFMNAVQNDLDWQFMWDGKAHGKAMPARELWGIIMESNYNFAEPGFLLIDRINKFNNLWFCENIRATNPCVTGDTLILTRTGYKRIDQLVGKKTEIWNGYQWSHVVPEVTGHDQPIMDIGFSTGATLACTPYHRFVLQDGSRVEAQDIEVGDKLQKWEYPVIEGSKIMTVADAYTQGFYSGDGSTNRKDIWLYKEKMDLAAHMSISALHVSPIGDRAKAKVSCKLRKKSWVPTSRYTIRTRLSWLSGLIDSDGTYQDQSGFNIWSIDEEFLLATQRMLHTLGVSSVVALARSAAIIRVENPDGTLRKFNTKDSYRLSINKFGSFQLIELGLTTHRVVVTEEEPQRNASRFVVVTSISERDTIEDEVYCFNEPLEHTGIFNGIMTAQCGEQPLPPSGSCLLGSINLTEFVESPFTESAYFNFKKFENTVAVFTRMLDNVVEINGLPLPSQRKELEDKRRHGMGFLGLGSTQSMLGMRYGSPKSVEFTEAVTKCLAVTGFRVSAELSREKGEAPILTHLFKDTDINALYNSNFNSEFPDKGSYTGRELFLMSHYFDQWREDDDGKGVLKEMKKYGSRFTHHSSIAPTGTISLSLGNNCSNGIEPSFSHHYVRNVIREGMGAKQAVDVYSYEFLLYRHLVEKGEVTHRISEGLTQKMRMAGLDPKVPHPEFLPESFSTTDTISPKEHIVVQAAAQKWVDSSISKTINVPTDISREDFQAIYMESYKAGLKGATTFRFNPEAFSGVLVKKDDMKNTMYTFVLETGEEKSVSGDTMITYQGQTYTAANLFDAIKENYFNKI